MTAPAAAPLVTGGPAVAPGPGWAPLSSVLICDDRPDQRRMLTDLVRGMPDRPDVTAVGDGPAAVQAYTAAPADPVFIGVHRGSPAGTDTLHLLLESHPTAAVIVYGPVLDAALLVAAVDRGARGLLVRDPAPPRPRPAPRTAPPPGSTIGQLTDRELQILHGMSNGQTNIEIGLELGMSQDAVKSHAHRMFRKLGARDRAHAVLVALRNGLLG